MFERIILQIIQGLEFITSELKRAYNETFYDKEFTRECYEEISKRCSANKELFIRKAAGFIGRKILDEEGYIIPTKQAVAIGEIWFNSAKEMGLIDILNNVIE